MLRRMPPDYYSTAMRVWTYFIVLLFATSDGLNATGSRLVMHEQADILYDHFFTCVKAAKAGDFERLVGLLVHARMDARPRTRNFSHQPAYR